MLFPLSTSLQQLAYNATVCLGVVYQAEKFVVTAMISTLPTLELGMCVQGVNMSAGHDNALMQGNGSSLDDDQSSKEYAIPAWTSAYDVVLEDASIDINQVRTT